VSHDAHPELRQNADAEKVEIEPLTNAFQPSPPKWVWSKLLLSVIINALIGRHFMQSPAPKIISPRPNGFALIELLVLIAILAGIAATSVQAQTINWQGFTWKIKSGSGLGPGPNKWNPTNCFVDANGSLHLLITADASSPNGWDCAELYTTNALGFGTYQWQIETPINAFDPWVVLGLFPYLGPDGTNEIDIEYSRWSNAGNSNGWWTIYPSSGTTIGQQAFTFSPPGTNTTSRFAWNSSGIQFWLMDGFQPVGTTTNVLNSWTYAPLKSLKDIPQTPMPLHINLWLFQGHAPANGQPVQVIIDSFKCKRARAQIYLRPIDSQRRNGRAFGLRKETHSSPTIS
jgi:hypothetical protein